MEGRGLWEVDAGRVTRHGEKQSQIAAAAVFVWKTPPIAPPRWQMLLAGVVHIALYGLTILMPIAGWLILSAEGEPISFWGLNLPPLIAPDKALAEQIQDVHETIATVGYFLIGLHAAAALYHHYVVKDDALARMLPGRG